MGDAELILGDFLILPGLKLYKKFIGNKISDHIPWSEVEHFASL